MPKIKIDHVVSFSSEDSVHVANNLLLNDPAKKWKCRNPGEKSSTVVLQLEKASVISAIDIGNENSAYIEVLVARSGGDDDYRVLLVMSSFMTPLEARQSTNPNKVRMFVQNQLSKPECEQKWDRVKIVCTQPFNRHVSYGLSFITFHTIDDKLNGTPTQTTIGKFLLRPDSPVDKISTGSLFEKRKELGKQTLSAAAAIREASSSPSSLCKPKLKPTVPINKNGTANNGSNNTTPQSRNRNELLYSKDEEEANEKIDKIIEKKNSESKTKIEEDKVKPSHSGESSKRKKEPTKDTPKKKRKTEESRQRKPFHELLKGVTLVISGIQNPDRATLRSLALEMGAKYKPDWDNSCTHLICAFANTPKFNQVKGKGKIVKRTWIEECHSQRKRLPWRRFCLDKSDSKSPESEDEIWEKIEEKPVEVIDSDTDNGGDDGGFDDSIIQEKIKEIQAKQAKDNPYSQDTDDEVIAVKESKDISKTLPNIFESKTFFIDDTLEEDICKQLERYIIAYKGDVAENPSKNVDYFITTENNVDNLRTDYPEALFLRPDWVWECHDSQSLISSDEYKL